MIKGYDIVNATAEHAVALAPRMARADKDEVWALANHTPLEALMFALNASEQAYAGLVDDRVECMFGLANLEGIGASPWLLTSEDLTSVARKTFVKESKRVVDIWKEYNDLLVNYVDERHTAAIRWLRWLGFQIYAPISIGSGMFHRAEWKKHV